MDNRCLDFPNFYADFPEYCCNAPLGATFLLILLCITILMLYGSFTKKYNRAVIVLSFVLFVFLIKIGLIFVNENFSFIQRKPAGNFVLWMSMLSDENGLLNFLSKGIQKPFHLQLLLNHPVLQVFGYSRLHTLTMNSFITSLTGLFCYKNLKKYFGHKPAFWALVFVSIYPAAINFSIFGLRDPVVYCLVLVNIVYFISFAFKKKLRFIFGIVLSLLLILLVRAELISFIIIPYVYLLSHYLIKFFKRHYRLNDKIFILSFNIIFLIIPGLVIGYVLYNFVTGQIGAKAISPIDIVDTYATNRYNRHEGGSAILPPNLYHSLPWYGRWGLQSLGIIILPFPWLIKSVTTFLASIDSLFIIILIILYKRTFKRIKKSVLFLSQPHVLVVFKAIFITFILSVLIMGIIVNNAGNAFRMRLSIFPYIGIVGALSLGISSKIKSY